MKRTRLSCILIAMTCSVIGTGLSTSAGDSNSPRHPSSVALEFSLPGDRIEARVPIVAQVTLSNRGNEPMTIRTREEGTPAGISLVRVSEDGETQKMPLSLRRSGPRTHDVTLATDEHISGEVLLFDREKGFPFAVQGKYGVSICWTSRDGSEKACSDQLEVDVLPPREQNTTCLMELQDLAIDYYADGAATKGRVDPAELDEARIIYGNKLLAKVIGQRKPFMVADENRAADQLWGKLAGRLEDILSHHPNSSYSGYIARFLGLIHVKTFEHEISHRGAGSWGETIVSPEHQEVTQLCKSEYEKALRYLRLASQEDLWPRTTAPVHLGRLHGLAEEWAEVSAVCDKLRTDYAEQHGIAQAEKLENEMRKYREKIARRKETD